MNDNAPRATVSTLTAAVADVATVHENAAPGTFVGRVIVDDPDRGSSGRFNCSVVTLTSSVANGNDDDDDVIAADRVVGVQLQMRRAAVVFPVAEESRQFRLERMYSAEYHLVTTAAAALDRERVESYRVGIACIDGGPQPLWSVRALTVDVLDVNDNAPVFDRPSYAAEVYENNYGGIVVAQVGYYSARSN